MAKILSVTTIAFGDVPAAYGAGAQAAFGDNQISYLTLLSTLDVDVYLSVDGTNNHFVVPAGLSRILDPKMIGNFLNGNLRVKRVSGAAASGNLYIEAIGKD